MRDMIIRNLIRPYSSGCFHSKGVLDAVISWIWMDDVGYRHAASVLRAYNAWLSTQTAAFALVLLLWPTAAALS